MFGLFSQYKADVVDLPLEILIYHFLTREVPERLHRAIALAAMVAHFLDGR